MEAWPTSIPDPVRTVNITPGNDTSRQVWQSGRADVRRFGSGTHDTATLQLRLSSAQAVTFETFWYDDLNLGVNQFTASWLSDMGYTSHCARILGYPRRKGLSHTHSDYSITIVIQDI